MSENQKYMDEILDEIVRSESAYEEPEGNLSVSTWYGKSGDAFHITLGRTNTRTGYEKRIAIPQADVIPVLAQMVRQMAQFRMAIDMIKEDRMRTQS